MAGDAVKRKVLGRLHELRIYGDGQRRKFIERSPSRAGSSSTRRRTRRTEFDACSLVHTYPHTVPPYSLQHLSWLVVPLRSPCSWQMSDGRAIEFPQRCFSLTASTAPYRGIVVSWYYYRVCIARIGIGLAGLGHGNGVFPRTLYASSREEDCASAGLLSYHSEPRGGGK